jgi:hypothetical protein
VRLRLRTAATNWPIVHPSGDIWAWGTTMELCRQRTSPDSSTRALWQLYQKESSGSKQEERGKGMVNSVLLSIFVYSCLRIASLPKEGVLQIFIALKNSSLRQGLNSRTSGLMANTVTITPPGRHEVALRFMKVNCTLPEKDSNLGFQCCTNIVTLAIT